MQEPADNTSDNQEIVEEHEVVNDDWTRLDVAIVTVKTLIWICVLGVCIQQELALLYIVLSGFVLIYLNLGNDSASGRCGLYDAV